MGWMGGEWIYSLLKESKFEEGVKNKKKKPSRNLNKTRSKPRGVDAF
jgi:hypothetical protein